MIHELPCYHCGQTGVKPPESRYEQSKRRVLIDELIPVPRRNDVPNFARHPHAPTSNGKCAACGKMVSHYPCPYCHAMGLPPPLSPSEYASDMEPSFAPEVMIIQRKPTPATLRRRTVRLPAHQFIDEEPRTG
jgi:hypothetical protein